MRIRRISSSRPPARRPLLRRARRALDILSAGAKRATYEFFGPFSATDHEAARILRGRGAESLFADWIASSLTPDDFHRWNAAKLRNHADDLARSNPYIRAYFNLLGGNVIGPEGFKHQARVRNADGKLATRINGKLEESFARFAESPCVDRRLTLVQFEKQALRGMSRTGEAFVRIFPGFPGNRWRFAMQAIDTCQIDEDLSFDPGRGGNKVRLGIEVDGWGAPVGYYLKREDGGHDFVPARYMIHLFDAEIANQYRGISWLAPIMKPSWLLDRYEEAECVAARAAAGKTGFFQTQEGAEINVPEPEAEDEENDQSGDEAPLEMSADPGVAHQLPPGWEFVPWSADHPSQAFPAFVKTQLRKVATGLSVSYNALASDLEGVNYSSMRSGLLIERLHWKSIQVYWRDAFRQRIYREWLSSALLGGALTLDARDPILFEAVRWTPPGWPWVDPQKDISALKEGIALGVDSRTRAAAERGDDFEEILEEIADEEALAEELGVDISGGAGDGGSPAGDGSEDPTDTQPPDGEKTENAARNGHGGRLINRLVKVRRDRFRSLDRFRRGALT